MLAIERCEDVSFLSLSTDIFLYIKKKELRLHLICFFLFILLCFYWLSHRERIWNGFCCFQEEGRHCGGHRPIQKLLSATVISCCYLFCNYSSNKSCCQLLLFVFSYYFFGFLHFLILYLGLNRLIISRGSEQPFSSQRERQPLLLT